MRETQPVSYDTQQGAWLVFRRFVAAAALAGLGGLLVLGAYDAVFAWVIPITPALFARWAVSPA